MPSRNCRTRPLSWKIASNSVIADAIKNVGWDVVWVFVNIIASVDNMGRMEGGKHQLRDMFFPHHINYLPERVHECVIALASRGLIMHYTVSSMWYIQLPKVGNWVKLIGNMSVESDFPSPPNDFIKNWEDQFNDVYTPYIQSINDVSEEVLKERKKESTKERKKESITITTISNLLELWNSLVSVSKISIITGKRREKLALRMKEPLFYSNFETLCKKIKASDFLTGRRPSKTHPNFKANFDWVIANDTNYVKILEGRYDNETESAEDYVRRHKL